MTHREIIDYIETIGGLLFSWPAIVLICIFVFIVFRHQMGPPLNKVAGFFAQIRSGKLGPVEFERFDRLVTRGESSISTIEKINVEIAKSRIIELEVSLRAAFVLPFKEEERKQMAAQVENLKRYIQELTMNLDQKKENG
jgi:hypothetical protein